MRKKILLPFAVFTAGLCSIVYELLVSTAATYFLGDGVTQFSLIIGVYLFSMGIGAFFSKYFKDRSLLFFINIEYLLGLVGGISVPLIYYFFVNVSPVTLQLVVLGIIFVIGLLTGMEVPLLTFSSKEIDFKNNLSNVLSLDYIGGLIATLIFPFILLPFVGLFYSSLIFGIVNILLGITLNIVYHKEKWKNILFGVFNIAILLFLVFRASALLQVWDEKIYKKPIVLNVQTSYQKIVMTKANDDVRLYLNRVIQFASSDEHRYHEPLIHVPLATHPTPNRVLILGGGENLASREVLKDKRVQQIDVVDIDSMMFHLAKTNAHLLKINQQAASDSRVKLIAQDAFTFLNENNSAYDVIISDLPDPSNQALARLYSKQFFLMVKKNLKPDGVFVTQSGEIYFSNTVFSCINTTLKEVFPNVRAYHSYIPSFGDWGFNMASDREITNFGNTLPSELKYLTQKQLGDAFVFPKDISIASTGINTLDNPIILNYYLDDWKKWKTDFESGTQ